MRNVDAGLITLKIELPQSDCEHFQNLLEQYYLHHQDSPWNIMRKEALRVLLQEILLPEMEKEIRINLANISENLIISKCKHNFQKMLMTGPFIYGDVQGSQGTNEEKVKPKNKKQNYF
jgi:transcriptional accessory protein Tex/SPT6